MRALHMLFGIPSGTSARRDSHVIGYASWPECQFVCGLCAQQLLGDFVLGLRSSSDVFDCFVFSYLQAADDCLVVNFAMDSDSFAAWKDKRMFL